MKKQAVILAGSIFLAAGILTGCARTPEESLVKMKGKEAEKNYEEADKKGDSDGEKKGKTIREILGAPKTYQSEEKDETGLLTIHTDAEVEIPDVEKASVISVSQHPFDQETIDKLTEIFFPDAKIYSGNTWHRRTKPQILKELNRWKAYLAAGELDPNGWGKDENGNYNVDIYQIIEELEAEYETAPEEVTPEEVKPQFGLEQVDYEGTGGSWISEDQFSGVAETPEGKHYTYHLQKGDYRPFEMSIRDLTSDEKLDTSMYISWEEYSGYREGNHIKDFPDEEELKKRQKLTFEEAKRISDEKVKLLEIPNMELTAWDYGLYLGEIPGEKENTIFDVGYIFHYSRKIDGIAVTYTSDPGGEAEDLSGDMPTWGYEELTFYIGSDGISLVDFNNYYDVKETKTQEVKLKSFDEIIKTYEKMMLIQNAQWTEDEREQRYDIDRIVFGYTRIYEPSTDSKNGILVPAWDFFGSYTAKSTEEEKAQGTEDYTNSSKSKSYLTINAIDGSVINRSLGY